MPTYQSQAATEDAVGALSSLGLTSYEAKCYVALLRLGRGTAREIADLSTVPRSRVYDATKSLHDRGFIDIEYSNPRTYRPVAIDRALTLISERRENHERTLKDAVTRLPRADPDDDTDDGVWTVSNHNHVRDRESRLVEDAEESVLAYARGEDLTQSFLHGLAAARERGVNVTLLLDSDEAAERVAGQLGSGTDVVTAPGLGRSIRADGGEGADAESGHVARVLCIDDRTALVVSARDDAPTDSTYESAVWSGETGAGLGLVHLVSGVLNDAVR